MSEKHDLMQQGFETWKKLAITRMGVSFVGVAEDKRESLNLLLEAAFEAGFSFGGATAERNLMNDLCEKFESAKKNGSNGKTAITLNGIPQPDHGHA